MVQNHVPNTPDGEFLPHAPGAHLWRGAALPPLGAEEDPGGQDCLVGASPSDSSPMSQCPLKAPLLLSATTQSLAEGQS